MNDTITIMMLGLYCDQLGWYPVKFANDLLVWVTGTVANMALLLMFLKDRTSSASKVLGWNLVVMDLIFLAGLPVVYFAGSEIYENVWVLFVVNGCMMVHMVGCPLLFGCMCVERYLAVMRPVLYLRLRKSEYRVAVCSMVWIVTLGFSVPPFLGAPDIAVVLPICILLTCMFVVMLASLGAVIRSLRQQSPALAKSGKKQSSESRLKRQAVHNVLVVVVPAAFSYSIVLVVTPVFAYLYFDGLTLDSLRFCHLFQASVVLLRYSVFIGPLFYLSRARKMSCFAGREGRESGDPT